jgi:hypothetical protein
MFLANANFFTKINLMNHFQNQFHKKADEKERFSNRFKELSVAVKKMESDGIRQTDFKIVNKTRHQEINNILVDVLYKN